MKISKQRLRMILTIGACAGIGVTAYISAKEGRESDPDQNVWENYKFTILSVAVTEACVVGSHKMGTKQIAAIGGTLASMRTLYHQTEKKVREKIGDEKYEEIKREVLGDRAKMKMEKMRKDEDSVLYDKHADEKDMFYESATDQYFYGTKEGVIKAHEELMRKFIRDPRDVYNTDDNEEALGVSIEDWIKLLKKHNPKSKLVVPDYEEELGWFYGDADGIWNDFWSYYGTPWIDMTLEWITEGMEEGYWFIDYGTIDHTGKRFTRIKPAWAFPDKAYKQEVKDAKMRWENEYA